MSVVQRINISISIAMLIACAAAWLFFGWSGSGWKALAIPTGSMRPNIPPGSLVLVHRVPVSSLKVGDVITHIDAVNPKITISHRIIKAYKIDGKVPAFVTKGDANKVADTPIVGGEVVGKVVWHVPYLGWALLDAKKPIVILPIVYLATLLIMAEEVMRLRDYYRFVIPYRAAGFSGHEAERSVMSKRVTVGVASAATVLVLASSAFSPSALAAIHKYKDKDRVYKNAVALVDRHGHRRKDRIYSNTVSLTDNRISVKARVTKGEKCYKYDRNKHCIEHFKGHGE